MKSLVIYDSLYGNTKIIAETIAGELGKDAKLVSVSEFKPTDLEGIQLLVAGSPINGWRPSAMMIKFLDSLEKNQLKGIKATAFDTRINIFFHGEAAEKIAKKLKAAGAEIITPREVFFVQGTEGPLKKDEVEKAKSWARLILQASQE